MDTSYGLGLSAWGDTLWGQIELGDVEYKGAVIANPSTLKTVFRPGIT